MANDYVVVSNLSNTMEWQYPRRSSRWQEDELKGRGMAYMTL